MEGCHPFPLLDSLAMEYECVKCGHKNAVDAQECAACRWPLNIAAWEKSKHRISKVTKDSSCINAKQQHPALNQLEEWEKQGLIRLQGAEELRKEAQGSLQQAKAEATKPLPTNFFTLGGSCLGGGDILAGPEMWDQLRVVLFPTVAELNDNQKSDVNHLAQHIRSGGDAFVTLDMNFIKDGKQEAIRRYGIWVFHPEELVALLRQLHKWD